MLSRPTRASEVILIILSLLMLTLGFAACGQQASIGNPVPSENDPSGQLASVPTTVLSIVGGNVFLLKSGSTEWIKAEEGMNLEVDYKLKTDANGRATVAFFDGSTIELKGDTEIALQELGFNEESSAISVCLKQELGQTISRVKKLADTEARYEIETPAAVAAVRGTTMYVEVDNDGLTFVGNIEGLVGVIAQGAEVELVAGTHVLIVPGQSPGPIEPGAVPSPMSTSAVTSTPSAASPTDAPLTGTGSTSNLPLQTANIAIEKTADRQTVYPGDTVVYYYKVTNTGSGALSDISVADNKIGEPTFTGGDTNANQLLDESETWMFNGTYLVKAGESGFVTNLASVSATGPDKNKIMASTEASVKIADIVISITSLQQGNLVTRTISVGGTINDPSITQANISVNGQSRAMEVIDGNFNTSVELADGTNTITVSATKPGGVMVSSSVTLVPQP
jgi:hypothetical protein